MTTSTERPPVYAETLYLTANAREEVHALDKELVGTDDYMGLAYFWAYEYRYPMRETSAYYRVCVHRAFLAAGLEPAGESTEHQAIIDRIVGDRYAYKFQA